MRSRYFFDKRDMKRGFAKYGIIFLISFIPLVLFNIFAYKYIGIRWLIVLLDCVLLLLFVAIGNNIARKIFEKKDARLNAKVKAREEMQKRKRQILEDSYKKIREEKKKAKEQSKNSNEIVVEVDEQEGIADGDTVDEKPKNTTKAKTKNRKDK